MYKVVGFNLKYMKRQLRTADDIKAEGITRTTHVAGLAGLAVILLQ